MTPEYVPTSAGITESPEISANVRVNGVLSDSPLDMNAGVYPNIKAMMFTTGNDIPTMKLQRQACLGARKPRTNVPMIIKTATGWTSVKLKSITAARIPNPPAAIAIFFVLNADGLSIFFLMVLHLLLRVTPYREAQV